MHIWSAYKRSVYDVLIWSAYKVGYTGNGQKKGTPYMASLYGRFYRFLGLEGSLESMSFVDCFGLDAVADGFL